jgi:hypothetical protein
MRRSVFPHVRAAWPKVQIWWARCSAVLHATSLPPAPWFTPGSEADHDGVPSQNQEPASTKNDAAPGLAILLRPPVDTPPDLTAMELLVQSLALSGSVRATAIALELVGQADARALVVRTASRRTLDYVAVQIQARYPQCEIRHLTSTQDAFCRRDGESVSARELRPTGPPYLSLRTWMPPRGSRQEYQMGVDPLLGILAALGPLPPGMRAIAQLALTPAAPAWSRGQLREADRYSLATLRMADGARERQSQVGSLLPVILLFLLILVGWWLLVPTHHAGSAPFIGPAIHQIQVTFALTATPQRSHSGTVALSHILQLLPILVAWAIGIGVGVFIIALLLKRLVLRSRARPIIDPEEVARKTQQPAYHARLRLFVISPQGDARAARVHWHARRQHVLDHLTGAYRQFHRAGAASLAPHTIPALLANQLVPDAPYWEGDHLHRPARWTWGLAHSPGIFSLAEIASLWHLPQAYDLADIPGMDQQNRARTLFAPPAVMAPIGSEPERIIGVSHHAGHTAPVTLGAESIRHHSLLVAKTGKGKSSLLLLLARLGLLLEPAQPTWRDEEPQIAASPRCHPTLPPPGMIVVDPHGDLAYQVVSSIPEGRRDDVIVLDLADSEHPPAINPLDVTLGRNRDKAVENLLLIFADIWDKGWGYRMENAMAFALKTLYAANETLVHTDHAPPEEQFTLLDVAPLLLSKKFRQAVLLMVHDATIHEWWQTYFDALYERLRLDVINPVLTKVSKFSGSIIARRILGVPASSLDLTGVIHEGKILIINTAAGVVGADTARLIGATILGLVRVTLEEQAAYAQHERRRLLILVDEFQTLQGVDFGAMLGELRKFGATFILATQALAYLDTLDPALRATVMANIDNLFAFAMSADDARVLERELDGVVTTRDLINLPAFTCYAKVTAHGRHLPVFSLELAPPPIPDPRVAQRLREASRAVIAPRSLDAIDTLLAELALRHPPETGPTRTNTPVGASDAAPPPRTPIRSAAALAAARRRQRQPPQREQRTNFTGQMGVSFGQFQRASEALTSNQGATELPPQHKRGKRGSGRSKRSASSSEGDAP